MQEGAEGSAGSTLALETCTVQPQGTFHPAQISLQVPTDLHTAGRPLLHISGCPTDVQCLL